MHILMINSGRGEVLDYLPSDAELTVITEDAYTHLYPPATRIHVVKDIGDLTAVRALTATIHADRSIDRIVGPSERSLQAAGYLRSFFGIDGTSYDVSNRFSNKLAMKNALKQAGLPLTDYRGVCGVDQIHAAIEDLGYPVVVKPALGAGGSDAFVLRTPRDLTALVDTEQGAGLRKVSCPLLVERFVDMSAEYHCDGVVRAGSCDFLAVSSYFTPLLSRGENYTGSYVLPKDHPDTATATALHQDTVEALGLDAGVTHMELFRTPQGLLVSEISCRPAGIGVIPGIARQTGVDLWHAFIDAELGRTPSVQPRHTPSRGIVVNCALPLRSGRIIRISAAEDLSELPGVTAVDMRAKTGDFISPRLFTSSASGYVFLEATSLQEVEQLVHNLRESFVLDVEPV
ncbi:MAG TPA: ATP-grasp domain-containing protein [Streptomyces sp.]|uniref:ATP-grasp domain-containing protein n=1 Tax=Streptomyces sp. TaxID=1931 RepID=UPI002BA6104D|nr:ATP-grasp domain-containing protein [Streptomyces sp.]HWU10182.1 ATP-grasp domain-containing protein [Streptomyces sp.]